MHPHRTLLVALACLAAPLGSLMADSDIPMRDATPKEKAFLSETWTALHAAFPPAPDGWTLTEDSRPDDRTRVSEDFLSEATRLFLYATYANDDRQARSEELMNLMVTAQKAVERTSNGTPKILAPKMAAMDAIGKELGAAFEKGDMAAIQAVQARMNAVSEEIKAVYADLDARTKIPLADRKRLLSDAEARVAVSINDPWVDRPESCVDLTVPGAAAAFRYDYTEENETGDHWRDGQTDVLLGPWRRTESGYEASIDPKRPMVVQCIHVRIAAAPDRALQLFAAMKADVLRGLLEAPKR